MEAIDSTARGSASRCLNSLKVSLRAAWWVLAGLESLTVQHRDPRGAGGQEADTPAAPEPLLPALSDAAAALARSGKSPSLRWGRRRLPGSLGLVGEREVKCK